MGDSTISQLPPASSVASTDLVPVDQGTVTRRATVAQVQAAIGQAQIANDTHLAASKTTPVDADELPLVDSASGFTLKKLTLANLKATLAALTDTWGISITGNAATATTTTGNSATATALQTSRTIDGQSFDGTANITVIAPGTHAAANKATPADGDEFPLADSGAAFVLKNTTWLNIKATLKAYFDPLYAALAGSASQVFSVGTATAAAHAVRADQIQDGGLISYTTGGTGTAYTFAAAPALTAYAANQTFNVIFTAACGAAPTLQINGIATPPNLVRQNLDGTYANLAANDFPAGWQSTVKLVSATQALVLKLPPRTFIGSLTRDLTAASGSVATTGLNFKPRKITFKASLASTTVQSDGWSNGVGNAVSFVGYITAANGTSATVCIFVYQAAGAYQIATTTMDADGFTLAWVKTGAPTGTADILFFAEE